MQNRIDIYPQDGGLREPVRSFEETPSVFETLVETFFSGKEPPRLNLGEYPNEPLREPVRTFEETLPGSVFHSVRDHFFPDAPKSSS